MTDEVAGAADNVATGAGNVVNSISQDQVNDIVRKNIAKTEERVRAELEAKYQQELADAKRQSQVQIPPQQPYSNINKDDILSELKNSLAEDRQKEREREQERLRNQQVENFNRSFYGKLDAAKGSYEDYDDVIKEFNDMVENRSDNFAHLAVLADQEPNTADIIYELTKNPIKANEIQILAERDPIRAKKKLQELSSSISGNKQAKANAPKINEPLSRLTSSVAGTKSDVNIREDAKRRYKF